MLSHTSLRAPAIRGARAARPLSRAVAARSTAGAAGAAAAILLASSAPAARAAALATLELPAGLSLDDPLVLGGAGAAALLTLGLVGLLTGGGGGPQATPTSPQQALAALGADPRAQLLDIRPRGAASADGVPDLSAAKKKLLTAPFSLAEPKAAAAAKAGTVKAGTAKAAAKPAAAKGGKAPAAAAPKPEAPKPAAAAAAPGADFVKAVAALPAATGEGALLILIDEKGAEAPKAAALLAAAPQFGAAKVYYVTGGAAAWQAADAPWRAPAAAFSLSLPGLPNLDALADAYKENPNAVTAAGAVLAMAGTAAFAINEFEVLLELAGLFAVGQFALKNLLYADSREKTLTDIDSFVKATAVDEAAGDLAKLATTILDSADAQAAVSKLSAATATSSPSSSSPAAPANVKDAQQWVDQWKSKQAANN